MIWIAGKPWDFEQVTSLLASAGIAFEPRYYRDALVVRAALVSGCRTLYTEDLQHGQTFEGLRVVNPFREADEAERV